MGAQEAGIQGLMTCFWDKITTGFAQGSRTGGSARENDTEVCLLRRKERASEPRTER